MKLSQIEQVLEVARVGSISQAAENLYISQPKLSLSIKQLELDVGGDIFTRTRNGVTLTHFGRMFIGQARYIMAEVETMEKLCQAKNVRVPLELRIGSKGSFNLDDIFAEITRKYHENPVEIHWFDMDLDDQIEALKKEDIEIGLITVWEYRKRSYRQKILSKGLEYRRIAPARVGVFVSKKDTEFIAKHSCIRPEDLQDKPIIVLHAQDKLFLYLEEQGYIIPSHAPRIYVDDMGCMREAINAVNGYGFATCCDAIHPSGGVSYPDMQFIPLATSNITSEFGCIINPRSSRSVLANEVLTALAMCSC